MDFRHLIVTCLFSKLRLPFDNQKVKENYAIFFKKIKSFLKKNRSFFKNNRMFFDAFLLVLHNMAKYLVFLSEVSASPQTSCSSAFRLKDIHDKILQPKKIFQRDRVSDVVLVGFLSVFGFTFIHLLTTAERKNYAVEGSRCINLSAGMPMNRTFAEKLKLLKDFWGHSSREGYFSSKDGYAYQKEGGKTLKTCRKMSQFL